MVHVARVRSTWSGWPGGPGVSTMYYAAAPTNAQLAGLQAFWSNIAGHIPVGIKVQVENTGSIVDAATGKADDAWSGPVQTAATGSGTGGMSAASGVHIRWNTGQFFNGRAVRGRTFIVPTMTSSFDPDGTINTGSLSFLTANVGTFFATTAGGLTLYSHRALNAFTVTSFQVIDKQVVLRSRRA